MRFLSGERAKPRRRRFQFEKLEKRNLLAGQPYGALPEDTMELMLGDVAVTVVLFESDNTTDNSTEDWTPAHIAEVKTKVQEGLDWWVDALANVSDVHSLNFIVDWQYADQPVSTQYEPIDRRSQDYYLWGNEFLEQVGFRTQSANPSDQIHEDIRRFNHSQREQMDANWAFTIFVPNSDNDPDDSWNGSGTVFQRAFAHSGGRVIVVPSGRPNSTFAHEVGHQAMALDEYFFGGDYRDRRGYLDIANTNAENNPAQGFVHQDSIMSNDTSLANAYAQNISSVESLAMVGWQDSDNDGVFDPLDVPHRLTGSGRANGLTYEFAGFAKVETLFNRNSKLFIDNQWVSDMTINEISEVQYRIDNGQWMTGEAFTDTYMTDLDIRIDLPDANPHTIDIRTVTIDPNTLRLVTTSNIFTGSTTTHEAVSPAGVSGFVYHDTAEDTVLDASDRGLSNFTVSLRDQGGSVMELKTVAEPDGFAHNTVITSAFDGVTLTAEGSSVSSINVKSLSPGGSTSTGTGVFGNDFSSFTTSIWGENQFELRMDFDDPVTRVLIDAVAELDPGYGRLEAYNANDELVARYTTDLLQPGDVETMEIVRNEGDIAYAVAFGHANTFVRLDQLQFGAEAVTTSNAQGYYEFQALPSNDYFVQVEAPSGFFRATTSEVVNVDFTLNSVEDHVDFGFFNTAAWHNAFEPFDVDDNGVVNLLDAFTEISGVRDLGVGQLPDPGPQGPPPYYDVNGNNRLDLQDALAVIDAVRDLFDSGSGAGESDSDEGQSGFNGSGSGGGVAEGEAPLLTDFVVAATTTRRSAPQTAWAVSNHFDGPSTDDLDSLLVAPLASSSPSLTNTIRDAFAGEAPRFETTQKITRRQATGESDDSTPRGAVADSTSQLWLVRDLGQLAAEETEQAVEEIAAEVAGQWLADDSEEESSKSELSLK